MIATTAVLEAFDVSLGPGSCDERFFVAGNVRRARLLMGPLCDARCSPDKAVHPKNSIGIATSQIIATYAISTIQPSPSEDLRAINGHLAFELTGSLLPALRRVCI